MAVDVPRFWLVHGSKADVYDQGFLRSHPKVAASGYVITTRDLDRQGCAILLGAPGMGKTTSLVAAAAEIAIRCPGDTVRLVDLGATGQEERLRQSVFGTTAYLDWRAGDGILHLLLDGFDEARLRVETVADLLLEGLDQADRARLHLVIACRSGARHQYFEQRLAELFGAEAFAVFDLLPLRRDDVAAIAADAGVPAEPFLWQVDRNDVSVLAARPITLRFLLSVAADERGLSGGPTELYDNGCRAWAAEHDEDRRFGVAAGGLDVGSRLAIAARIAAAVVLSGRVGVHVDARSSADEDDVPLTALTGGREVRSGAIEDVVAVDEAAIRETLGTGLFTARGHGRFVFVHQTVAEFLAASYMATRMRPQQMLDLVTLRIGERIALVPQLQEVAQWLCGLSADTFLSMLDIDPEVALASDLTALPAEQAVWLVDALLGHRLRGAAVRGLPDGLRHPGLHHQLEAVLIDRRAPAERRETAIELAAIMGLSSLAERIVDLALDEEEPLSLRVAATASVGWSSLRPDLRPNFVADGVRRRLRSLALGATEVPDELRSIALAVVFDLVSPEELFSVLDANHGLLKRPELRLRLPGGLHGHGLAIGLDWAAGQSYVHRPSDPLFGLVEDLMVHGWEERHDPEVFAALVRLVQGLLGSGRLLISSRRMREETEEPVHAEWHVNDVFRDRAGRRALVRALLPAVADGRVEAATVAGSTPPLLDPEDLSWLEGRTDRDVHEQGEAWGHLARALRARASLGSPPRSRAATVAPGEPPLDVVALVEAELDRFDAGDLDAFWRLGEHLALDQDDPLRPRPWAFRSDLRSFPGWARLDEARQQQVVVAARRFLEEKDPDADGWFAPGLPWAPGSAGVRALRLLGTDIAPELDPAVWERWAPAIMGWPRASLDELGWAVMPVICLIKAPFTARDALLSVVDRAVAEQGRPWPLEQYWPFGKKYVRQGVELIESPLLERVRDSSWPPIARGAVLDFLLSSESEEAIASAAALLAPSMLAEDRPRAALLAFAQAFVERTADASWTFVWPLFLADPGFGRELIHRLSTRKRVRRGQLTLEQIVDLVEWMDRHPPTADERHRWSWTTTASEPWATGWVSAGVRMLARTGTEAALEAIERLPGEWGMYRDMASDIVRRANWQPPEPADVVRLGADRARRWVVTDAELREVLLEALARAQAALQAATPAAADLWDSVARRPKQENEISDWLQRWLLGDLRRRGIVIGREVQIRPGPRGKMGESGDLVVEAIAGERTDGADTVTVTIEVKGCWHPEVRDALRHQLVERYLLPTARQQGIYVVAWFPPSQWDTTDYRRRAASPELNDLRALLAGQAAEVSASCGVEVDAVVLDCSLPGALSGP